MTLCVMCFDVLKEHVQIINETIKGMLQTLLINIDKSSSEHSGICSTCQGKLENCYYFKKKCMFTEYTLGPFITENVKINLNEIPIQTNKSEDVEKDKNVCRLCLQYSDDDTILSKNVIEHFHALFPEINLNLTNFVVLCSTCFEMLQKYFLFVPLSSRSEDPFYKFLEDSGSRQNDGNSLEDCQELTSSEKVDEKKFVLLNADIQIKSDEKSNEEERLCSSSMDCSMKQIIGIKLEETVSTSVNTDDEDDKKLMLLHEELDIKSEGNSSEKEFFDSNPGKKNSNFKMQAKKVHVEQRGLSFNNLEESTCATNFRKFPVKRSNGHKKNTILIAHSNTYKSQMYECEECDYKTKVKGSLKSHIIRRHIYSSVIKKYECDKCDYKCKLLVDLKRHVFIKHSDPSKIQIYKCENCNYESKYSNCLKRHVMNSHTDPSKIQMYECEACDYKTKYKSALKSHIMYRHTDHSKTKKFKCDKCDYKFRDLKKHIRQKHSDPSKIQMYKCKNCNYKSTNSYNLKRHVMSTHTGPSKIQMYECEECDYKAKQKAHLKTHMLYRHIDPSKAKKFKCDKCNYKCILHRILNKHILTQHSDPSKIQIYECEECDHKTKYKSALKSHIINRHTDPSKTKKFQCDKCDHKSKRHRDLKRHILQKHTDSSKIQMYQCEECALTTKYKYDLKRHLIHLHSEPSKTKKIKCNICNYKCKFHRNLKKHMFTHNSNRMNVKNGITKPQVMQI